MPSGNPGSRRKVDKHLHFFYGKSIHVLNLAPIEEKIIAAISSDEQLELVSETLRRKTIR
jgi:hypothetical protein